MLYNRFIIAEIRGTGKSAEKALKFNSSAIYSSISKKIQQLHGDFGTAAVRTGMVVKYYNMDTCLIIIRVRHGPHKLVSSSLPIVTNIDKESVSVNTLYVGATLKQCFKYVSKYQQGKCDEVLSTLKTDTEKHLFSSLLVEEDDI